MKLATLLLAAFTVVVGAANAQGLNLQALQQQFSASPAGQQAQQMLVQQALQQLAANPQVLTTLANSLTPQQQATLAQQAITIGQQVLTPTEQAKLTAFTASPEGASIASKLPLIAQQLAPTVLQMVAGSAAGANTAPAAGK